MPKTRQAARCVLPGGSSSAGWKAGRQHDSLLPQQRSQATSLGADCPLHTLSPIWTLLSLKVTPPKPSCGGFKNHFDLLFYRKHGRLSEFNLSLSLLIHWGWDTF